MTTTWLSLIDDVTGEPTFVNPDNVTYVAPCAEEFRVFVHLADGGILRVRCSMQDIAIRGCLEIAIIEAPVS
jgi:hypothetical protein